MQQIKRSKYLLFAIDEEPAVDIAALLRGEVEISTESRLSALTPLTEEKCEVRLADLSFLAGLSSSAWTPVAEVAEKDEFAQIDLERLVQKGLLLIRGDDLPSSVPTGEKERLLWDAQWHASAALYHFMDRTPNASAEPKDVAALAENAAADASEFVRRHGPPPKAFHEVSPSEMPVELPVFDQEGGLYEVLRRRKTVRAFDTRRALNLEDFSTLLRYVFGCHGYSKLSDDVLLLHKTSPSGGSLHPIEAYPLVLNVESVTPGIYHYDVKDHTLSLLRKMSPSEARRKAVEFSGGQLYVDSASVLVIMTTRFYRNQWKYRLNSRTYGVMLMDAGHLSQTFYLVAEELGLGAFYTAAINGPLIEEEIGVKAPEEGALGLCGCGVKLVGGSDLGLPFKPFVPRKTDL